MLFLTVKPTNKTSIKQKYLNKIKKIYLTNTYKCGKMYVENHELMCLDIHVTSIRTNKLTQICYNATKEDDRYEVLHRTYCKISENTKAC